MSSLPTSGLPVDDSVLRPMASLTLPQGSAAPLTAASSNLELTIDNIPQLYPQAMNEYNRVKSLGDRRTWAQWASDHMRGNDPAWLSNLNREYASKVAATNQAAAQQAAGVSPAFSTKGITSTTSTFAPEQLAAIKQYADSHPDAAKALTEQFGGDYSKLGQYLEGYWQANAGSVDPSKYPAEQALMGSLGWQFTGGDTQTQQVPVEQYLGNTALNNYLIPDIQRDKDRSAYVDKLLSSYSNSNQGSQQLVQDLMAKGENGGSKLYDQELAQSDAAKDGQLGLLGTQSLARLGALTNQYNEKLGNINAQVDDRTKNLSDQSLARLAALTNQYNELGGNITSQQDALHGSLSTYTDAEKAALATQLAGRHSGIDAELATMRDAQNPVDQARLASADAAMTGVNLGVENTQDQIRAQMAQQGFTGGSSASSAALARAAIAGRQQAASVMGEAKLANATDSRQIGNYGANQYRTLSDFGADQGRSIAGNYDQGLLGIDTNATNDRRTLGDWGANQRADLSNFVSDNLASIRNQGGTDKRTLGDWGADQRAGLSNYVTDSTYDINNTNQARKLAFFNSDITRRLGNLNLANQQMGNDLSFRSAADQYRQQGLNNALKTLSNFSTNGSSPTPATSYYQQPNTAVGSAVENIGAGMTSLGGNIALSQFWANRNQPAQAGLDFGNSNTGSTYGGAAGSSTINGPKY